MACQKSFLDLTHQGKLKRLRKMHGFQSHIENDQSQRQNIAESVMNEESATNHLDVSEESAADHLDDITFHKASLQNNKATSSVQDILNDLPLSDDSEDEILPDKDPEEFNDRLKDWSIQYQISAVAFSALLCIPKTHSCFGSLPSDSHTVLKTPTSVPIRSVDPGLYCHVGFESSLKRIWSKVTGTVSEIKLIIGIDGLLLFKSSAGKLWPILASVVSVPSLMYMVFPVGVYYGNKKPAHCADFFKDFVQEISSLVTNGIMLNGQVIPVSLMGFCCDAPAKAFILGIKRHTGYSSCTKCIQEGSFFNNRLTFPEFHCTPRTNVGFLNKVYPDFHTTETPLIRIPDIHFNKSFPLDYMVLVCLGVVHTMIYIWMFASVPLKLHHHLISSISVNLLSLKSYIPVEFCRKPRSLVFIKRWKATEFHQFLLYTGPVALQNVLIPSKEELYNKFFLSLHISLTILLSPKHCHRHQVYAKELLEHFVKTFKNIYRQQFITHNFHGLLHLADDVSIFVHLDLCSAFQFENFLHFIKKLIRKGDKPLQQVVKRLVEMSNSNVLFYNHANLHQTKDFPYFVLPHHEGPLLEGCLSSEQYKCVQFENFKLTTTLPNSCCSLIDNSIVLVVNITFSTTLDCMVILCKKFKQVDNFYSSPFCESSALEVFQVSDLSDVHIRRVSDISQKLVILPLKITFVVYKLN